jgi:DNA-binding response OmpR family regulator
MKQQPTILIIDDDLRVLRLLELNMQAEGYHIVTAVSGRSGYEILLAAQPDAVILDLILPDMNGFAFCEQVREFSDVPIIILTAHKEEKYLIQGLDAGADDYIAKPFRMEEMLARLRAVLRRTGFSTSDECDEQVNRGKFTLRCRERRLLMDDRTIKLSGTEFKLLYFLMTHANRLLVNDELISRVWGPEFIGDTEGLRTYIRYLRVKIEEDPAKPKHILTDRGIGYRFIE